jgi:hypothetical protein
MTHVELLTFEHFFDYYKSITIFPKTRKETRVSGIEEFTPQANLIYLLEAYTSRAILGITCPYVAVFCHDRQALQVLRGQ